MVASISTSSSLAHTFARSQNGDSQTGVKAELARYKKEYSACVNCESAKTEAGQRNIRQLDIKIKQLEARIASVQPSNSTTLEDSPSATATSRIDVFA